MAPVQISLTTFSEFMVATGGRKVGVVRDAKATYGSEYEPAFDYWRSLRKAIRSMHEGGQDVAIIEAAIANASPGKVGNFTQCGDAYRKWMGRRTFAPITRPPKAIWRADDLHVRINPEVMVRMNGEPLAMKLYFGKVQPTKHRLNSTLFLLEWAFGEYGLNVGVLDVRRAKLIKPTTAVANVELMVLGEAAHFLALWRALDRRTRFQVAGE